MASGLILRRSVLYTNKQVVCGIFLNIDSPAEEKIQQWKEAFLKLYPNQVDAVWSTEPVEVHT